MNKKTLIVGGVIIGLLLTVIIVSVTLIFSDTPDKTQSDIGILNPDVLGSVPNEDLVSNKDREEQNLAKPERTEQDIQDLDQIVMAHLTRLNFSGLSSRLVKNAEAFRDDQHIQDLKVDLANTMAANETTAPIFLMTYRTPEMLAAAVAYFPMDYKLECFLSADSYIMPAETGDRDIQMKKSDVSEVELQAMLDRANKNTTSLNHCSEAAAYDMTLCGLPCRLWAVKTPDGWRPFLLEQQNHYTVGFLTQLQARKIHETLYRTGATLEQAVSVQDFDEEAYLADMAEHPELYNTDGSRKPVQRDDTAWGTMPDNLR